MRIPSGKRTLGPLLCCFGIATFFPPTGLAQGSDSPPVRIERLAVQSSSLVGIAFARERRVLEIEFRSGAAYRYLDVPPAVFEEMKRAESKGRYFSQFIRGKYEFQRLKGPAK